LERDITSLGVLNRCRGAGEHIQHQMILVAIAARAPSIFKDHELYAIRLLVFVNGDASE
jgi:hypothetical protein